MWLIRNFVDYFVGRDNSLNFTDDTIRDIKDQMAEGNEFDSIYNFMIQIYDKYNKPEYYAWWENGATDENDPIYTTDLVYHLYLDANV